MSNVMIESGKKSQFDLDFSSERGLGIKSRVAIGILAVAVLIGGIGGWAATTEISGAVISQGQVMVDKDLRAIQHLDGGIIRDINVRKGDEVEQGQTLITLDDTQLKAESQIINSQLLDALAKRQRLLAERSSASLMSNVAVGYNVDLTQTPSFAEELQLFNSNRNNRESQLAQLSQGIVQANEELNGLFAQQKSNEEDLSLVADEAAKMAGLHEKGLIDGSRVYTSARDLNKTKGEQEQLLASIARARAHISELQIQKDTIIQTARNEAQKQLSELEPKIAELVERKSANADRLTRMEIHSPVAGVVNEVNVNTVGGVITPAQKLLTIVPKEAKLQIEIKIQPNDIEQIYVGQRAKLKFSAFTARSTPDLYGLISFVSPATSTDPVNGRVYYVGQVEVTQEELAKLGDKKLVPGMLVDSFIQTESRTALSYFMKPFEDQFARAFKER